MKLPSGFQAAISRSGAVDHRFGAPHNAVLAGFGSSFPTGPTDNRPRSVGEGLAGAKRLWNLRLAPILASYGVVPSSMTSSVRIIVIGAGFAGAATSWHLARRGIDVVVLERESTTGFHASGRNAAMIRQPSTSLRTANHAAESVRFFSATTGADAVDRSAGSSNPFSFRRVGSLLLGDEADLARLTTPGEGTFHRLDRQDIERELPALRGTDISDGLRSDADGIVDPRELLDFYLDGARDHGAEVVTDAEVVALRTHDDGRVRAVLTRDETYDTDVVVNAAGAWADHLAELAGGERLDLRIRRRHLFFTGSPADVAPNTPFVWDVTHGWYFRPHQGGLLLCACDDDVMSAGDPPIDAAVLASLRTKLARHAPGLVDPTFDFDTIRTTAGLRTFAPDGEAIVRQDAKLDGFVHVAGLGGAGVTCSYAIGRDAADVVENVMTQRLSHSSRV